MKKIKRKACPYKYMIIDISEDGETGFHAIIPKFPNIWVVADTVEEMQEVVPIFIEEEIERLKKEGLPIPEPDRLPCSCSGRFVLRVKPEVHERLIHLAATESSSLNQYVNRLIEEKIGFKAK